MIGKLLLTLMVIALAALYLRKRYQQDQKNSKQASSANLPARSTNNAELDNFLSQARRTEQYAPSTAAARENTAGAAIKIAVWTLLGIVLVTGVIASFLYWQDQQRLVTVLLHRSASEAPVIYRVPKRNLGNMEFVTEGGVRVTVSANERMEVVGL